MAKRRSASRAHSRQTAVARERIKRLKASMRAHPLSHFIVTDPTDVGYLTGFLGGDSVLILGPGRPVIVSDSRYDEELDPQRPLARIVMRDGAMSGAIAGVLEPHARGGKLEAVGVQREHMTLATEGALRKAFKSRRVPVGSITPTDGLVGALRKVKAADELRQIRAAIGVQQEALEEALEYLSAGMTEIEFAAELEYQMKRRGSSAPGFGTIVAAGANASLPHYRPSPHAVIRRGSPVLIDWGATVDGYRGDMTRVVCPGRWPREIREIYAIVLEAHEAAVASLKPGARCVDVDAAARGVIAGAGYGDRFGHGLGHGLGMNVHEAPGLNRHAGEATLEPGHVVTIEPGIYLPGIGGVRIEDDYAVTARGSKNLCTLPKDIDWATR